jgi:group I intron endonuclease
MMTEAGEREKFIIYKSTNQSTNQVYIGSTTYSLQQRRLDHQERANRTEEGKFYEAISTYGSNNFSWETIDTTENTDELALKEQYYIAEYDSYNSGYNSDCGGGFKKTVFQYCKETEKQTARFESLEEAAKSVNTSRSNISSACLGSSKSAKGFSWSYKDLDSFKTDDKRLKYVKQLDVDEVIIKEYKSIAEASRQTGISKSCIAKAVRGERQYAGGFLWIK